MINEYIFLGMFGLQESVALPQVRGLNLNSIPWMHGVNRDMTT